MMGLGRKHAFAAAAFVLGLAAFTRFGGTSGTGPGEQAKLQAGDHKGSIEVEGRRRTYRTHVPTEYGRSGPMPLVLAFHGRYGTGRSMERLTGLSELADRHGFIAVYPDGIGRSWNAGHAVGRAEALQVDDVQFVRALIELLQRRLTIDAGRIYAVGMSNGAILAHRLACEASDRIAGVVAVAGTIAPAVDRQCVPIRPVGVLQIHGAEDRIVPYGGQKTRSGGDVVPVLTTVARWVERNECEGKATNTLDDRGVSCLAYQNCKGGVTVSLCRVEDGGHTWPGGRAYLPKALIGRTNRAFDASEAAWQFLRRQPPRVQ